MCWNNGGKMNTINNKRKKESQEKIEKVFMELIQNKEISEITVTDICKKANLNRTTFYSNYIDVYDLADKIKDYLYNNFIGLYKEEQETKKHSYDFSKLLNHIKDNQIFYKTYFKLNPENNIEYFDRLTDESEFEKIYGNKKHIDYHKSFFMAGFNSVIKKWLNNNCKESIEEIANVFISEYSAANFFHNQKK